MEGLGSSDSMAAAAAAIPICPISADGHSQAGNPMYARELQGVLDGLDEEESGHVFEKKRRLNSDQVKVLEKSFEVENKLEPDRKVKLALELGLQPRQVAVWFQNRRARWKTKQLERDYGGLKANYDALKHSFEKLQQENEALLKEIRDLKSQLNEDGESESTKKETAISDNEEKIGIQVPEGIEFERKKSVAFLGGFSDSDSSAILNEDNSSPTAAISSSVGGGVLRHSQSHPHRFPEASFKISDAERIFGEEGSHRAAVLPHFVKIEEHNFFGEEDSCSTFFSYDQAPTLHWYSADDWN